MREYIGPPGSGTTIEYNEDLTGDAVIRVREFGQPVSQEVRLPAMALLGFAMHYIRAQRIIRLHAMSDEHLLENLIATDDPPCEEEVGRPCPEGHGVCYPSCEEDMKDCCWKCFEVMPEYGGPAEVKR